MDAIAEWQGVDYRRFQNEIVGGDRPAILRDAVAHWPAVKASGESFAALVDYLKPLCKPGPVTALVADPSVEGRFFYRHDLRGVNFQRGQTELANAMDRLLETASMDRPQAIAIQAVPIRERLTSFEDHNPQSLLPTDVAPTLWMGNRGTVAPHFDVHDNLACVVAGARRFTLFPPEQVANLYPGPALFTPAGVPVSMVDLSRPDLALYPKFTQALVTAQQSLLQPGDVIYMPALWWHGVESTDRVNMLVNYWWGGVSDSEVSPYDSLLHSMMSIADLSETKRRAWKHFFDYFVFKTDAQPSEHLPTELDDLITGMNSQQITILRQSLARRLHPEPTKK